MRERVARRLVIVAASLAATGTLLLAGAGCGGDASEMDDAVAPASPNIAFTFAGGGIYAMRADGSGRVKLTRGHADPLAGTGDADPAWSPDGTTLAFVRTVRLGFEDFRSQVYLLSPGGGGPRPITEGVDGLSVSDPAWSPDGRRIAYVRSTDTESAIVVAGVDGSGEQVLWREPTTSKGGGTTSGSRPGLRMAPGSSTR